METIIDVWPVEYYAYKCSVCNDTHFIADNDFRYMINLKITAHIVVCWCGAELLVVKPE